MVILIGSRLFVCVQPAHFLAQSGRRLAFTTDALYPPRASYRCAELTSNALELSRMWFAERRSHPGRGRKTVSSPLQGAMKIYHLASLDAVYGSDKTHMPEVSERAGPPASMIA